MRITHCGSAHETAATPTSLLFSSRSLILPPSCSTRGPRTFSSHTPPTYYSLRYFTYSKFYGSNNLRYIIIKYSHYSLGLSHSFSQRGNNKWILKVSYFIFLFTYMSSSLIPNFIKSYREGYLDNFVKGRICLLKR